MRAFILATTALLTCLSSGICAAAPGDAVKETIPNSTSGFADCVVRKHGPLALSMVIADPSKRDLSDRFSALQDGKCARAAWKDELEGYRFEGNTFKFMLAEALVRSGKFVGSYDSFESTAPLHHTSSLAEFENSLTSSPPRTEAKLREWRDYFRRSDLLATAGECIVRKNPMKAYEYIVGRLSPEREAAGFNSFAQDLQACLPVGERELFTPLSLRGALAWNYVRLANASRVATRERG